MHQEQLQHAGVILGQPLVAFARVAGVGRRATRERRGNEEKRHVRRATTELDTAGSLVRSLARSGLALHLRRGSSRASSACRARCRARSSAGRGRRGGRGGARRGRPAGEVGDQKLRRGRVVLPNRRSRAARARRLELGRGSHHVVTGNHPDRVAGRYDARPPGPTPASSAPRPVRWSAPGRPRFPFLQRGRQRPRRAAGSTRAEPYERETGAPQGSSGPARRRA